jgi:acyl-CoA reductase-like NAD-dependent aldehyde dehydrogenase
MINFPPPQLLIGGQWVNAAGRLPVTDPFTRAEIAQVPLGDAATVEAGIAAAHAAFPAVRELAAHERAALLEKIAAGIAARRQEFADTIVAEAGKPVSFAEAEVARAIMTFKCAADEAGREHGGILPLDALPTGAGHFGVTQRFPIGVISAITPFNFPLNLVAHKVAPCIATGNTMVVKPATRTPLTALLLARVLADCGTPAGQINFITCSNDDASLLVTDDRVRKVTFTGSPAVGWRLKALCGKKRITLELGGNAGCIVHADADLDSAIAPIALGAFGQAGQSCISVQRIVVHEAIYETFRERFIAHVAEKIRAGDPRQRETVVGPMITLEALAGIRERIAEAVAAGARIVHGGGVREQCLEPTILENAPATCALCAEEAFAPIATLHRYRTFDEALAFVNDSKFGLQAGVFTRDLQLALRAFRRLDVGGVLINQVPTFRVESMPYGGVKDSGFGREGVRYAMEEMTELRSLIIRTD